MAWHGLERPAQRWTPVRLPVRNKMRTAGRREMPGVRRQVLEETFLAAVAHADDETFLHQPLPDQQVGGQVGLPGAGKAVVDKGIEAVLSVMHVQHRVALVDVLFVAAGR